MYLFYILIINGTKISQTPRETSSQPGYTRQVLSELFWCTRGNFGVFVFLVDRSNKAVPQKHNRMSEHGNSQDLFFLNSSSSCLLWDVHISSSSGHQSFTLGSSNSSQRSLCFILKCDSTSRVNPLWNHAPLTQNFFFPLVTVKLQLSVLLLRGETQAAVLCSWPSKKTWTVES